MHKKFSDLLFTAWLLFKLALTLFIAAYTWNNLLKFLVLRPGITLLLLGYLFPGAMGEHPYTIGKFLAMMLFIPVLFDELGRGKREKR